MEGETTNGIGKPNRDRVVTIRDFPAGFTPGARSGESADASGRNSASINVGSGGISPAGTGSPTGTGEHRDGSGGKSGTDKPRNRRSPRLIDSGISDSAANHTSDAAPENDGRAASGSTTPRTATSTEKQLHPLPVSELVNLPLITPERKLVSEVLKDNIPETSPDTILALDTSPLKLPEEAYVVKTAMAVRADATTPTFEPEPESEYEPPAVFNKAKGKAKASTTSTPAEPQKKNIPYKMDSVTRDQLEDMFVWLYQAMDELSYYGMGVDTKTLPIWQISKEQAATRVRILERRAQRDDRMKDVVIPWLLDTRDYMEVTIDDVPKLFATIKEVIENGGIHPQFVKRKDG